MAESLGDGGDEEEEEEDAAAEEDDDDVLLARQKKTVLVKSWLGGELGFGVAGASSRKMRHVGKTEWMVRTTRAKVGRRMSPA